MRLDFLTEKRKSNQCLQYFLSALVTLPVEFDASRRALVWITESGVAGHRDQEYAGAKDALWWAGMTYMVAALAAVAQFLYLVLLFLNRR